MREISAKGFTRLIGNGTEFKKVGVTYILAITCGFGFYPLHTYLNGRTIGAFDDICNIRHLFVAYFQGRNMVYGLRAQSPKYNWDQGSEERAQGSEEWDQGSQGF